MRWPRTVWLTFLLLAWGMAGETLAQPRTPLVTLTNAVWRFNDTATDLGTAWRAAAYPAENQWPTGRGLFGVESTVPYPYSEPVRTALVLNAGRTTYYFRTRFNFPGSPPDVAMQVTATVDDGAVFYLNGAELHRVRLPAGPIAFTNKATLAYPEGVPVVFSFPASQLNSGDNVLAVEVHQHSDTSSDAVFGLALDALAAQAPAILDPTEPSDRTVNAGESTTLVTLASGFPPPSYQWFQNGVAVSGATEPSLMLAGVSAAQAGDYFCRVMNSAGTVTSRTAVVTVFTDTTPPAILYALGQQDLYRVMVAFSEPLDAADAESPFAWEIFETRSGLPLTVSDSEPFTSSNLMVSTEQPRDPNLSYSLRLIEAIKDLAGNELLPGLEIPIAWFESAPLVPNDATHLWRYDQSGVGLGADWVNAGYDDTAWLTGAGPFDAYRTVESTTTCRPVLPGVNPPDNPVRTCLTLSNAANTAQIPTIYFRTRFTFSGDAAHSILRLQTIVNDGAVFYLNGVELTRLAMLGGTVTYNTPATGWAGPPTFTQLDVDAPSLIAGENVLAMELHQGDLNDSLASSDFTFALKLLGVLPSRPPPRLTVQLTEGNIVVSWTPEGGTLESTDDPSGAWAPVLEAHSPGQYIAPAGDTRKFYRVSMP